jgi:GNAT superfamily N-acetyltransferase
MKVRLAVLQDAETIAKNNMRLADDFSQIENVPLDIQFQTVQKGVVSAIEDQNKGFYLVAEDHGEVVGQIFITSEWSDWRSQEIWWLHRIFVQRDMRRKGILRLLLEDIKKKAKQNNIYAIRLYLHQKNQDAIKAYQKLALIESPFKIFSKP